jgi:hypothetical protein
MTTFPKEFVNIEYEVQVRLDQALKSGDQEKVRNLMDTIIEIHAQSEQPERGRNKGEEPRTV